MSVFPVDEYEFGLCLTHDVDRPIKSVQALYHAIRDRRPHHIRALLPGHNPWWTFDTITAIERSLGVRSAFYFLREPHLLFERPMREWVRPYRWIEHLGRYNPSTPPIAPLIRELARTGWEIGLHGSLGTHQDAARLGWEKERLEEVLGAPVAGGRQHWLRHDGPETWRKQVALGLKYDCSLGSSRRVGFKYGYDLYRPFDDEFVVFPTTIMDKALERQTANRAEARDRCDALLDEALANGAIMTIDWHVRVFNDDDYPAYSDLYRHIIERALELDAWVGSPGELYRQYLESDNELIETEAERPTERWSVPDI